MSITIDEQIAVERRDVTRMGLEAVARIEKLLPNLKKCIEGGGFPVWLDDVMADARVLGLLAAKSALLTALECRRVKNRRRGKSR